MPADERCQVIEVGGPRNTKGRCEENFLDLQIRDFDKYRAFNVSWCFSDGHRWYGGWLLVYYEAHRLQPLK